MRKAAILALALGWLPLGAAGQTPDGAADADTVRSAVERIEASRNSSDNPGLSQSDSDAVNRLKAGGVQSPELSAIGNAARSPAEASGGRETLYERPSTNEVRREPADAAPPAAGDDSKQAGTSDPASGTDPANGAVDKNAAASSGSSDPADNGHNGGQSTAQNDPADPNADPANPDPPAGADPASPPAPDPGHLRRVPRSRTALYRDPRIETMGDEGDEPPRPLTPSAGFERVHKSAAGAALALPPRSAQSFESAGFGMKKSGFGPVEMRTAAAELPRRTGGGFELADRRPPKRVVPRMPDPLATP